MGQSSGTHTLAQSFEKQPPNQVFFMVGVPDQVIGQLHDENLDEEGPWIIEMIPRDEQCYTTLIDKVTLSVGTSSFIVSKRFDWNGFWGFLLPEGVRLSSDIVINSDDLAYHIRMTFRNHFEWVNQNYLSSIFDGQRDIRESLPGPFQIHPNECNLSYATSGSLILVTHRWSSWWNEYLKLPACIQLVVPSGGGIMNYDDRMNVDTNLGKYSLMGYTGFGVKGYFISTYTAGRLSPCLVVRNAPSPILFHSSFDGLLGKVPIFWVGKYPRSGSVNSGHRTKLFSRLNGLNLEPYLVSDVSPLRVKRCYSLMGDFSPYEFGGRMIVALPKGIEPDLAGYRAGFRGTKLDSWMPAFNTGCRLVLPSDLVKVFHFTWENVMFNTTPAQSRVFYTLRKTSKASRRPIPEGSSSPGYHDHVGVTPSQKGTSRDRATQKVMPSLKGTKLSIQNRCANEPLFRTFYNSLQAKSRKVFGDIYDTVGEQVFKQYLDVTYGTNRKGRPRTGESTEALGFSKKVRRMPRFKRKSEMTPLDLNSAVVGESRDVIRPYRVRLVQVQPVGEKKQSHVRPPKVVVTAPPYVERISSAVEVLAAGLGTLTATVSGLVQQLGSHFEKLTSDMAKLLEKVNSSTFPIKEVEPPSRGHPRYEQYSVPLVPRSLSIQPEQCLKTSGTDGDLRDRLGVVHQPESDGKGEHHETSVVPSSRRNSVTSGVSLDTTKRVGIWSYLATEVVTRCTISGTTPWVRVAVMKDKDLKRAVILYQEHSAVFFFYGRFYPSTQVRVSPLIRRFLRLCWLRLDCSPKALASPLGMSVLLDALFLSTRSSEALILAAFLEVPFRRLSLMDMFRLLNHRVSLDTSRYQEFVTRYNEATFHHIEVRQRGYDLQADMTPCLPLSSRLVVFKQQATIRPIGRHCHIGLFTEGKVIWSPRATPLVATSEGLFGCSLHRHVCYLVDRQTVFPVKILLTKELTHSEEMLTFFRNLPRFSVPKQHPWMLKYQVLGALREFVDKDTVQHMLLPCYAPDCIFCQRILSLYAERAGWVTEPGPLVTHKPTSLIEPVKVVRPQQVLFDSLPIVRRVRIAYSAKLLAHVTIRKDGVVNTVFRSQRPDLKFICVYGTLFVIPLRDVLDLHMCTLLDKDLENFHEETASKTLALISRLDEDTLEQFWKRNSASCDLEEHYNSVTIFPPGLYEYLTDCGVTPFSLLQSKRMTADFLCSHCGTRIDRCRCMPVEDDSDEDY